MLLAGHVERQPYLCAVSRSLYGFASIEIPSVIQPGGAGSCRQYQSVCRCRFIIRHRERCLHEVVLVRHLVRPRRAFTHRVHRLYGYIIRAVLPTAHVQCGIQIRSHVAGTEIASTTVGIRPREIDVVLAGRTADAEGISQIHGRSLLVLARLPSNLQFAALAVEVYRRGGHALRGFVGRDALQEGQVFGGPITASRLRRIGQELQTPVIIYIRHGDVLVQTAHNRFLPIGTRTVVPFIKESRVHLHRRWFFHFLHVVQPEQIQPVHGRTSIF